MNYLELIGSIIGLIYLWLEYKVSIYLWIVGIIMPAIYIFIYYKAGLYADFGINIYYLFASVYGWIMWTYGDKFCKRHNKDISRNDKKKEMLPISSMKLRYYMPLTITFIVTFFVIAWILINYTNSNVPYLDSFTTALSIVGMWMLAKKNIEQWIAWVAVDGVSTGLYIYKGLYFTSILYGIYTIMAIFGYFKWKKLMKQEALDPA
ncbi:MAG: nicotinamide riboside transporter PnuC [Bacteroidaceae bacterium]|nr:nicotinamide riboside transporter PnuC [Bacteroidaceae bacterium]